ncbi:hypothetical protein DSM104299_03552 [Baekduia alba]|uniref:hypothetical protein n=1 Tax=Baekduia alba TaxID=2997333 RepID=UPI00234276E8|nr:hypothetical protein [Baekduia alba]WCB94813.1 hypothetical protein DSM104299_03552 [Baekduia alba]
MADRVLIISWGQPVRGREQHGLEVLGQATAFYGELAEAGRIESFDIMLLEPNGLMNGCMVLHGTHAQLDDVAEDMRFRRLMVDASLVVDALRTTDGYTAEGIEQTLPLYADAVGHVPQMA